MGTYREKWAGMSGYLESGPLAQAHTELREETSLEREDVSTPDSGRAAGHIRRENQEGVAGSPISRRGERPRENPPGLPPGLGERGAALYRTGGKIPVSIPSPAWLKLFGQFGQTTHRQLLLDTRRPFFGYSLHRM